MVLNFALIISPNIFVSWQN